MEKMSITEIQKIVVPVLTEYEKLMPKHLTIVQRNNEANVFMNGLINGARAMEEKLINVLEGAINESAANEPGRDDTQPHDGDDRKDSERSSKEPS